MTDMSALRIVPGCERAPIGVEWTVLHHLPVITLAGTGLPIVGALGAALFLGGDPASAKVAATIRIVLASVLVLHWTVVFTVALLCVIVLIAKGSAYVANAYPLIDSERPKKA
jgi:hypothetical protein